MNVNHQLLDTLNKLGQQGKPVQRLYARMLDERLFIASYVKLYANTGAMTTGSDPNDSIDGMSLQRIRRIIETLRNGQWRWKPSRRRYISKGNGKSRPLSVPNWSDKLVQDVMRTVLEAYYEPQFCEESHGFRPQRGCHTALQHVKRVWTGVNWFIEGDIEKCFDTIDHDKLLDIIGQRIRDFRFMKLLRTMLKAGYIEDWQQKPSLTGTPQGGIISPLLANIFLHELDSYVLEEMKPNFDSGKNKRMNRPYQKLRDAVYKARKAGNHFKANALLILRNKLPSRDPKDEGYRRLVYIRYADDFMLGVIGSKREARAVKDKIGAFLQKMNLTMSDTKTKITHATKGRARFLGYDIQKHNGKHPHRHLSGRIHLTVPKDKIAHLLRRYMRHGKPMHRRELAHGSIPEIIRHYDSELRGYYNYYRLASNVSHRLNHLRFIMQRSLSRTIANKMKLTRATVYKRYGIIGKSTGRKTLGVTVETKSGEKVITFGDYSLRKQWLPTNNDRDPFVPALPYKELTQRLNATECELCGKTDHKLEVHHIRRLRDIRRKVREGIATRWQEVMAYRSRKTLVVCYPCHRLIHAPS